MHPIILEFRTCTLIGELLNFKFTILAKAFFVIHSKQIMLIFISNYKIVKCLMKMMLFTLAIQQR
jgi:hypothetical protein